MTEEKEQEQVLLRPEEEEREEKSSLSEKIFIGIAFGIGVLSVGSGVVNFRKARKQERANRNAVEKWANEHNANVEKMDQLEREVTNTRRDWMATAQRIADRLNVKVDRDVI